MASVSASWSTWSMKSDSSNSSFQLLPQISLIRSSAPCSFVARPSLLQTIMSIRSSLEISYEEKWLYWDGKQQQCELYRFPHSMSKLSIFWDWDLKSVGNNWHKTSACWSVLQFGGKRSDAVSMTISVQRKPLEYCLQLLQGPHHPIKILRKRCGLCLLLTRRFRMGEYVQILLSSQCKGLTLSQII